jgi:Inner membrane component of T3SS, cytoplasmic domain/Class III cytochrome C family
VPFIVQKIAGQQSMIAYVPSAVLRIGRGTNAELRLDDVAVALEHAVIEPVERGYRLLDRGSATGTYLNGKPVREAALLSANDLINIGGYDIRVQITDPEDPLFLSVRAGATVVARAGTMAAPPRVIAAAVQAAAAHEAARRAAEQEAMRRAAELEAAAMRASAREAAQETARDAAHEAARGAAREAPAQGAAPAAQAATAPTAPAPAGPAAWEVASSESVTAADAATMRMSPEALAAAVRAATAMAAAAGLAGAAAGGRVARATEAGAAPSAPAVAPSVPTVPPAPGVPASPDTPAMPALPAVPAASMPPPPPSSSPAAASSPAASPLPSPSSPPAPSPSPPLPSLPSPSVPSPPAPPPRALPQPPPPSLSPPPPSPPPRRQPSPAVPALRAPVVDYLGAYSLRRPLLNKALLSLVLTAGAAAALLFLARSGRATAFEPGRVHAWHAETACASCHSPWRGPDPALCSDCHARQREKGEIHQARQTFTPPCTGCHPEHRGGDRVTAADDTQCASCHRDLKVNPPGAEPRFARRVNAFFDDHPDFSVTLPSGVRLPLAEAVARRADPTPLRFNHQRHLRAGLPTPSGQRVQLGCQSCHYLSAGAAGASPAGTAATAAGPSSSPGRGQGAGPGGQPAMANGQIAAAGGPTGIVPIAYETSCTTSGCHPLTFDNRRPDQVAPHASPRRVREFLVSVYSDRRGADESVADQYRRLIRGAGTQARGIDYGGQAQGAVVLAERYLYGTACKECHVVDTNARPLPRVTWTPIPARWLPNGRFQHLDHPGDCRQCHGAAADSTVAADVLLPAIAICRTCHGGGGGAAQVRAGTAPAAPTDCLSCHRYHPGSPNPALAALASPVAPPAPPARALPRAPAPRAAAARPRGESAGSGIGSAPPVPSPLYAQALAAAAVGIPP